MCVRQRGQLSEELGYNLPCSPLTHKSNQPQAQNSSCSLPVAAPPPLIIPLFLAWRFLDQKKIGCHDITVAVLELLQSERVGEILIYSAVMHNWNS